MLELPMLRIYGDQLFQDSATGLAEFMYGRLGCLCNSVSFLNSSPQWMIPETGGVQGNLDTRSTRDFQQHVLFSNLFLNICLQHFFFREPRFSHICARLLGRGAFDLVPPDGEAVGKMAG